MEQDKSGAGVARLCGRSDGGEERGRAFVFRSTFSNGFFVHYFVYTAVVVKSFMRQKRYGVGGSAMIHAKDMGRIARFVLFMLK